MVETEAVMEKIYRVIEIPPDPPFSKGGNVLLFSETCRHTILAGMRSENSLGISPPLPNPEHLPPLVKGGWGGFNDRPKKTPNISPFSKGGLGGI
jgi:hypothetical protein